MIEIKNFSHFYGKTQVVHDLSLEIEKGDIYGFLGPNGAGKTTTIKFLATLLKPTMGQATINRVNIIQNPQQARKFIGFMPDDFGVYENMTVAEYLEFYAMAYGIARKQRGQIISDIIELVDLKKYREINADKLSRGMKQRLGLARALLHDPLVLLLDEPASGLDPRGRLEMMELLKALQEMKKTIIVSSHILSELANYCNKVLIINDGKLVLQGNLKEIALVVQKHTKIELQTIENTEIAQKILEKNPQVTQLKQLTPPEIFQFHFSGTKQNLAVLLKELVSKEVAVVSLQEIPVNLEDIFMYATRSN